MFKLLSVTVRRLFHWCEIFGIKVNKGSLNDLSPISSDIYNLMMIQRSGVFVGAVQDFNNYHFYWDWKEIIKIEKEIL